MGDKMLAMLVIPVSGPKSWEWFIIEKKSIPVTVTCKKVAFSIKRILHLFSS